MWRGEGGGRRGVEDDGGAAHVAAPARRGDEGSVYHDAALFAGAVPTTQPLTTTMRSPTTAAFPRGGVRTVTTQALTAMLCGCDAASASTSRRRRRDVVHDADVDRDAVSAALAAAQHLQLRREVGR